MSTMSNDININTLLKSVMYHLTGVHPRHRYYVPCPSDQVHGRWVTPVSESPGAV